MNGTATNTSIDPKSQWQVRFWAIWIGQALSLVGSAVTQFILLWWITSTTGSASALATAAIAGLLPQALLSPLGGTLADRLPRRLIMIVADCITAICMIILVILFSSNSVQLWHIYTLMFVRSSMQAFQSPALTSSVPNLVPTDWLPKIAGLNQSLGGIMTIAAAPIGALAMAWLPLQGALMIDVITAILGILPVLFYAIPQPTATQNKTSSLWTDFKEGLRFIGQDQGLRSLYGLFALVALTLFPAISLTPLLVKELFAGGANEVALMQGVSGIGIIAGGLLVMVLPARYPIKIMLFFYALACTAIALTALAPTNGLWLAVILWTTCSLFFSIGNAKFFAVIQIVVPNEMQGRAFSLLSTLMGLAGPLGLVIAGLLGETIGVRGIFLWSGGLCTLVCVLGFLSSGLMSLEKNTQPTK